ncbi:MAG TPA: ABC transporter substrate-binding protein [Candidatus Binataceae bacterium]|nr:ABC transporter substrate-binding protein [Candidatus Binataceae bacterium]
MARPLAALLAVAFSIGAAAASAAAAAAPPMRIVSLAPGVTETLFALGEGAAVVGVSQYCDYPPAATRLPKVGTFLTPNVEAIVALRPDLIVGPGLSSSRREVRMLEAMGYPTLTVDDNSLDGIERSITLIGARTGEPEAARRLLGAIQAHIEEVHTRLEGTSPRTVVMLVGHQPMVAVGRGTFLDDLLRLAGGDNIADLARQNWPQLSLEYIIAMRPEVILDGAMGSDANTPAGFWARYPTIPAVRDHRVFGYAQDPMLHPGPRVWQSLRILARRIHPEAFAASAADSSAASSVGVSTSAAAATRAAPERAAR